MGEDEGVYGWRGEDVWGKMRECMGGEGRMCEGRCGCVWMERGG